MLQAKNVSKKSTAAMAAALLFHACLISDASARGHIEGPFFNHDDSSSYKDPYRGIQREGSDLEALIIAEIDGATKTIDIAVQEFRLPNVARALARKQQAGVRVRLVIEHDYNFTIAELDLGKVEVGTDHSSRRVQEYIRFVDMNGDHVLSNDEISQRDAMSMIRAAKIPVVDDTADDSKGSPLMHHKFVVVDSARLLVTSANFTLSDTHGDYTSETSRGNANALLIFDDTVLVSEYQKEFNILWGSNDVKPGKSLFGVNKPYRGAVRTDAAPDTGVTVQFSPTPRGLGFDASTSGLIDRSLQRAQKSVQMALFVFSEQKFANTLQTLSQRFPLDIKVLVEPTFAYQWYSEVLDLMGLQLLSP
ncbi:MAG: phospholipase D-like domain-containing protein, partial [Bdellovibrionota bacterium]